MVENFKDDKQISFLWKEPQNAVAKGNVDDKGNVEVKGKHVVNGIVNVDVMGLMILEEVIMMLMLKGMLLLI